VGWYKGAGHQLIAFDGATVNGMDVFTIHPDGSGRTNITASSSVPKGMRGNPDWHPDGEHLLVVAENSNSAHGHFNHPAWGIDSDLWLIRRDGSGAERIYSPPAAGGAVLHPLFSEDGTKVLFADRSPLYVNPWNGWRLHVADFDPSAAGTARLKNHRLLAPNGEGCYEGHEYRKDGRIVFTFTADGQAYMDDVYEMNADGSGVVNLTNSPGTWEEHGHHSPDGRQFAFMSSRLAPSLQYPQASATQLVTELYLQSQGAAPIQVTRMNELKKAPVVVSDWDWDGTGKRLVFQVASFESGTLPELWILTLP
jgi:Tol biopolymer transport system component